MTTEVFIAYTILIILVLMGFSLAFREFVCWYFKINERLKILENIESKLDKNITD